MKTILFFTFFTSLVKSGILIGTGILIKNHFVTLLSMIIRRPIPEGLIEEDKYDSFKAVINWLGILVIILGAGMILMALSTLFWGFRMPMNNFNLQF